MKTILITGASGFVGKNLARFFLLRGDKVTGVGTSLNHPLSKEFQMFKWVSSDTTIKGDWQKHVSTSDIIINLTGRNIFRYWTKKYKKAIYDSRILTTRNIVNAIKPGRLQKLLTTSAIGIYGDCNEEAVVEGAQPGSDFLSRVCREWEKEGLKAKDKGIKVIVMRFGVVLGKGGALSLMAPAFKFFVGGPLGKGQHWFPWIHIHDIEKAIAFLMDNSRAEGLFNLTAPEPVRQKVFAKALGKALGRPAFMPVPAIMIKAVMGELGTSLLQSQRAIPENLTKSGYTFSFPDVESALKDIFQ